MHPSPRTFCFALIGSLLLATALSLPAGDTPEIMPVTQVRPGMTGVAYTIFSGDEREKMEVSVIGVLPNMFAPKTDIILVELKGPKVEHSGVVAGMSGSPVYIDGKLVGAIALKLGIFSKEAIAGVMPIEQMLEMDKGPAAPSADAAAPGGVLPSTAGLQIPLPAESARHLGISSGNFLIPIETPLVISGAYPQMLARYTDQLSSLGMVAVGGGTVAPRPDDAQIQPGDMVGLALVRGDLSLAAGCTVTAIVQDRVFVCGHPLFASGPVSMPLLRGHVVTTLNSEFESTKIMTTGGEIGTVTQDRLTAVMGRLGPGPQMIPIDLSVVTPAQEKKFHFEIIQDRRLTPLLVGLVTYQGIVANTAYSEGTTLQLDGTMELKGHSPLKIQDLFAPTDLPAPDGFFVATAVQSDFAQIFTNPYEPPQVEKVNLRITTLPERRWAAIDSAWSEKSEAVPGETVRIKVLLRPYRGAPFIREVPIAVPPQATRGNLQVLVSDAEILNRMDRPLGNAGQLSGLEELIKIRNLERHNSRLYVTLLQATPTLLVEDKKLPDVPPSAINVLNQRRSPGGAMLLGQSEVGEWSVEMNQVIWGQQYLTIHVK
jgi:hypothetical protein